MTGAGTSAISAFYWAFWVFLFNYMFITKAFFLNEIDIPLFPMTLGSDIESVIVI